MKDYLWTISIAVVLCCFIYFASTESQLEKRQEHEFVMKKLELESRYHVDSLEEVKWRKSYYELLKQCHDSE